MRVGRRVSSGVSLGRRLSVPSALVALLAFAGTARADERHRPFEVGIFGGYHIIASDGGLGSLENDPEGKNLKSGLGFGLRLGYGFNRHLGLELEGIFVLSKTEDEMADVNIIGFRGSIIAHLIGKGAFRPFVLLGWGGW